MNKSKYSARSLLVTGSIIVVLAVAVLYVWSHINALNNDKTKASLAAGYATQPLTAPFTLTGKSWDAAGKTWQYNYAAAEPTSQAVADAKSQLAKGAYQVVSDQPDVVGANSATFYRDLITEDVAVTVKISAATATTSAVAVTLAPMHK